MKKVILCGRGSCCPSVELVDEDTYYIKDDWGHKCIFDKIQFDLLKEKILAGEFD